MKRFLAYAALLALAAWASGLPHLVSRMTQAPVPAFVNAPFYRSSQAWLQDDIAYELERFPRWGAWLSLAAGAGLAIRRRWRWRSYGLVRLLALLPFGVLAGVCLVERGASLIQYVDGAFQDELPHLQAGSPEWTGYWIGGLAVPLIVLGLSGVVGLTLGALLAQPAVALRRLAGDAGFYARALSFRWLHGDAEVEVHVRPHRRGPTTATRVPLHAFEATFKQEVLEKWGHTPSVTTVTGYTSSGEMVSGTAYGPGHAYQYKVTTPRQEVRLAGVERRVFLGPADALEARWNVRRLMRHARPAAEAHRRQREADARQAAEAIERKIRDALDALARQAGLAGERWTFHKASPAGELLEAIAADRLGAGYAVCDEGRERWVGRWHGARLFGVDGGIDVQVDDPAHRAQHLAERRFVIGRGWPAPLRNEWASRIALLAERPAAS